MAAAFTRAPSAAPHTPLHPTAPRGARMGCPAPRAAPPAGLLKRARAAIAARPLYAHARGTAPHLTLPLAQPSAGGRRQAYTRPAARQRAPAAALPRPAVRRMPAPALARRPAAAARRPARPRRGTRAPRLPALNFGPEAAAAQPPPERARRPTGRALSQPAARMRRAPAPTPPPGRGAARAPRAAGAQRLAARPPGRLILRRHGGAH
jgi:hypothetical protein